ncbi:retinoid-inducible serine carboxypeptidase-like [Planoprotostelium fungivorum]|uniref:Carboxypeptidase n=1 Tax=Planoprotostelium fungivorum TaxID=1890364 RepID=A0A2P6NGG9_9EUKA|nr:retinoid-inducible serine carboxypeptidase-like [Planoprotostelium fungivorum]
MRFSVRLTIYKLNGDIIPIDVDFNDHIGKIKLMLQESQGIPITLQNLVFRGRSLLERDTVGQSGLSNGNSVHLVISDGKKCKTNTSSLLTISLLWLSLTATSGLGAKIPDEDWGYSPLTTSNASQLFWWFYGAQNAMRDQLPVVLWIPGGPGVSAMNANFLEFGQLDKDLKPRAHSWSKVANLLFVDSPVGTGWSYTINKNFTTTDVQIVGDLMSFIEQLSVRFSWLQTQPLWIFGESYGGKAAAALAAEIAAKVKAGKLKMDLKGVALGDSWISPLECMNSYGPFLESVSLVDGVSSDKLTAFAKLAAGKLSSGDGKGATGSWVQQQKLITELTGGIDFYDYLRYNYETPSLDALMESTIRTKLKIIPKDVRYNSNKDIVFQSMYNDFLKSATKSVEYLLNEKMQVAVYSGQLDVIVNVGCINNWVEKLNWNGAAGFFSAARTVKKQQNVPFGAVKKFSNLQLWNIYGATHMVPTEAPAAALSMVTEILSSK